LRLFRVLFFCLLLLGCRVGEHDSLIVQRPSAVSQPEQSPSPLITPASVLGAWQHWQSEILPMQIEIVAVGVEPIEQAIWLAASTNALYRSQNRGETWQAVFENKEHWKNKVYSYPEAGLYFHFGPLKNQVFFIAKTAEFRNTVYQSNDNGLDWQKMDCPDLTENCVVDAVFFPSGKSQTLFLNTSKGLYQSWNGGLAWQALSTKFGTQPFQATAIYQDAQYPHFFYALASYEDDQQKSRIFRSGDKGFSWHPLWSTGKEISQEISQIYSAAGGEIYAVTPEKVYISRNKGDSWSVYLSLPPRFWEQVPIDQRFAQTPLWLAFPEQDQLRWFTLNSHFLESFPIIPATADSNAIPEPLSSLPFSLGPEKIWLGTKSGIRHWDGNNWRLIALQNSPLAMTELKEIEPNLWLGYSSQPMENCSASALSCRFEAKSSRAFIWNRQGQILNTVSLPSPVEQIYISPHNSHDWYVLTPSKLYHSPDQGKNWLELTRPRMPVSSDFSQAQFNPKIKKLILHPHSAHIIYAQFELYHGTYNYDFWFAPTSLPGGLMMSADQGKSWFVLPQAPHYTQKQSSIIDLNSEIIYQVKDTILQKQAKDPLFSLLGSSKEEFFVYQFSCEQEAPLTWTSDCWKKQEAPFSSSSFSELLPGMGDSFILGLTTQGEVVTELDQIDLTNSEQSIKLTLPTHDLLNIRSAEQAPQVLLGMSKNQVWLSKNHGQSWVSLAFEKTGAAIWDGLLSKDGHSAFVLTEQNVYALDL
jgi:hypothetical protein